METEAKTKLEVGEVLCQEGVIENFLVEARREGPHKAFRNAIRKAYWQGAREASELYRRPSVH